MFIDNYLVYSIVFSILVIATGMSTQPPKAKPRGRQSVASPAPQALHAPQSR